MDGTGHSIVDRLVAGRCNDALGPRPTRRQVRRIRIAADVRAAELHRRPQRLCRSPQSFVASQPLLASEPLLRKRRGWRWILSVVSELLTACGVFAACGIGTRAVCGPDAQYRRSSTGRLKLTALAGAEFTCRASARSGAYGLTSLGHDHRAAGQRPTPTGPAAGPTRAGSAESARCRSSGAFAREA
jgi:hypothetical protein